MSKAKNEQASAQSDFKGTEMKVNTAGLAAADPQTIEEHIKNEPPMVQELVRAMYKNAKNNGPTKMVVQIPD